MKVHCASCNQGGIYDIITQLTKPKVAEYNKGFIEALFRSFFKKRALITSLFIATSSQQFQL